MSVPLAERAIRVTISLGVAYVTSHTPNLAALIDHADQAMLQAKAQGRNQAQTFR